MEYSSNRKYPLTSSDYKLYEEVGEGVSAIVYRALCVPFNEHVAIKVLDLERLNNDLENVRREVHTMGLINHRNVLKAHCSFISERSLWIVMPYMAGGSCFHIMKSVCPKGFEQPIIATILCEILKALAYLHAQGHIHRDVKAGNILIDTKGAVKLGDFGVSASMFDTGNRQRSRNTFVGTPCWMAPEVMQQLHGYDFKADIWSFGITALELAHGHAPFSKYPPMKVLMMTLQNAPPSLDYEGDKKFSKSFKDMVSACLVKDPKKRPTSEKLLKHRFFKHSRPNEFLARNILDGLPSLGDRFRILKEKELELLAQNKALHGDEEQISNQEYIRGISDWNFDLEDLKKQAALIPDCDSILTEYNQDSGSKNERSHEIVLDGGLSKAKTNYSKSAIFASQEALSLEVENIRNAPSSLTSCSPVSPLQTFNSRFDIHLGTGINRPVNPETVEMVRSIDGIGSSSFGTDDLDFNFSLPRDLNSDCSSLNWSVKSKDDLHFNKFGSDGEIDQFIHNRKRDGNGSPSGDRNFQCNGGLKVSRAGSSQKGSPDPLANPSFRVHINSMTSTSSSILSWLHHILQQNSVQRDQTVKLIRYVENLTEFMKTTRKSESLEILSATVREKELQSQVMSLKLRVGQLVEDLQEQKIKNFELEKQLSMLLNKT
ncbi:Protein kinase superfamily protein [Euphorbia peplus]|nr:Protein kinase superfamily protein [Euphorbia peplus]